jgi:hypothetical protein
MNAKSLADMPLYSNLDRIARGLSARGIGATTRSRQSSCSISTNGTITESTRSAPPPIGFSLGRRAACWTSAQASAVLRAISLT